MVALIGAKRKRRTRRIEELEISMKLHSVFANRFECICGEDVTSQVQRKMTYRGSFCDGVIAFCSNGHAVEYWMHRK